MLCVLNQGACGARAETRIHKLPLWPGHNRCAALGWHSPLREASLRLCSGDGTGGKTCQIRILDHHFRAHPRPEEGQPRPPDPPPARPLVPALPLQEPRARQDRARLVPLPALARCAKVPARVQLVRAARRVQERLDSGPVVSDREAGLSGRGGEATDSATATGANPATGLQRLVVLPRRSSKLGLSRFRIRSS